VIENWVKNGATLLAIFRDFFLAQSFDNNLLLPGTN
jgi:hypothetical protein